MEHTFLHKLLLAIIAGFGMACLVQFYKVFVVGADNALNSGYDNRYGITQDR